MMFATDSAMAWRGSWKLARIVSPIRGKGSARHIGRERKEAYLVHLRTADDDILWVSLADKVHYARTILRDLRKPDIGEKVWERFKVPKKQTLWYYRSLADIFCEKLSNQLSNELREIVQVMEAEATKARRRTLSG